MNSWKHMKFQETFELPLRNGLTKPSRVRGSGLRMINMKEIFGYDKIDDKVEMELVPVNQKEMVALLRHNDILFARQSLVESGAGKISIFKGNKPTVFESHLIRCRLNEFIANPDFIYYYWKSPLGKGIMSTIVTQTAAAGIKGSLLQTLPLILPPLPEQKAIASILSSLDDKIDLLHRQNTTLEALAETLFRQWFVEEAKEEWKEGILSDLMVVKYGKDHKKLLAGIIPVIGSGGVMRYANTALFEKESVLIPRKGSLNNVLYIDEPFWTVDTMFYTEMKRNNLVKFIYHFVKDLDLASMNVGSAVPSMTTEVINSIPIDIPPDSLIEKFECSVKPFYQKMKSNQTQIRTLTTLRDSLLPKLMSGEVIVEI
jgi:type I restriction enzyme S subunit